MHWRNYCLSSGLIMRAIRDTMVCAPPFTISETEVDELVAKAKDAIDRTAKDYGKMWDSAVNAMSAQRVLKGTPQHPHRPF